MRTLYGVFEAVWFVLTVVAFVALVTTSDWRYAALMVGANGLSLLYSIAGCLTESES